MKITAYFPDNEARKAECLEMFNEFGAKVIGTGVFLPTMERDICGTLPAKAASKLVLVLESAGFKVERSP